jgi:hypothetical protein
MVAVPAATPVTIPVVEPTVAMPVAVLVHTPPGVVLLSVAVEPMQINAVPVIAAGVTGTGLTVTDCTTDCMPQPAVTE